MRELKLLGLNVKAKNFIIKQNDLDKMLITMKNPKKLTELFEEISG